MKYSPEIIEEICGYLREGLKRDDACVLADIAQSTFYEWMHEQEFSEAVKKAELHTKRTNIAIIQRTAQHNWFAAAWWLERKFKDEFSALQQVDHQGSLRIEDGDLRALLDKLPPAEQQQYRELLAKIVATAKSTGEAGARPIDVGSPTDLPPHPADVPENLPPADQVAPSTP